MVGASLVRPLCALKCLEGSEGMLPPGKIFKIRNSEIASEAMFGQNTTRISPPVVSVAREAIEPT